MLKIIGRILGGLVAAYLILTACLYLAMRQPPEKFGAIMSNVPMIAMIVLPFEPLWMNARKGTVEAGDQAADVSLPTVDGSTRVTLSEQWRERPVALIFGSYT